MNKTLSFVFLLAVLQQGFGQTLSDTQMRNARATGYAIVAARNPGKNFSIYMIPWDGVNNLEHNANSINSGWHAQAAVKGNFFDQTFNGSDFSQYSSVVLSEADFNTYKSTGTQWWIVCSTLSPFSNTSVSQQSNGNVGIGLPAPNFPLDVKGDVNLDDGGVNSDLRIRLHQKAAVASYNTQSAPNDALFINRDWASGVGYHSDFNGVKIYSQGYPLDVIGDFNVEDDGNNRDLRIRLHQKAALASYNTQGSPNNILYINRDWASSVGYHSDFDLVSIYGNVGIGTITPDKPLTVKGTIHTNEVLVDMNVAGPDYVFEKNYDLLPLSALEQYITQNKHLPEVPSAKEMEKDGLNLKEMNLLLLKKIEELTLHAIAQEKR